MGKKKKIASVILVLMLPTVALGDEIPVRIGILEGLSKTGSTSSERFKDGYETAMFFAIGENHRKAQECGYSITADFSFYDESNNVELLTQATNLENQGAWIVFGPRRSNHYLMAKEGLKKTALVSPMANSDEVTSLAPPYFTMSFSNKEYSEALAKAIKKENYGKRYAIIVDKRCQSCRGFVEEYKRVAKDHEIVAEISLSENEPQISELESKIDFKNIDYLLSPNYSKLSGYLVAKLGKKYPKLGFAGSDGWGDGRYGYFNTNDIPASTKAIAVRSGKPDGEMKAHFGIRSLNRAWQGESLEPSSSAYMMVEFVRKLVSDLCVQKPKNKIEFITKLKAIKRSHFQTSLGRAVYKVKEGKLGFGYTLDM